MSYSVFLLYSFSANVMRAVAVLTCFLLSNRCLSYAKIMQMSGKRACSLFPECSLSYAKIMQMSGKRARSLFPECSLSYAKIMQDECNVKTGKRSFTGLDTAEPMLILCKDSERLAHCKLKSVVFSIFADIVQYTILCQIRRGKINN